MKLLTNVNYKKAYAVYKRLPLINFIVMMVLALAWGIVDACAYITDLDIMAILVWPIAGVIPASISAFVTAVVISPVVLRTDAACDTLDVMKHGASNVTTRDSDDALPEL